MLGVENQQADEFTDGRIRPWDTIGIILKRSVSVGKMNQ